ncbi:C2H2 finger domain transcription factor sebA [Apiospora kogelbergensis]|uniref:C2H2 finger domain transcription factor sebA n=1 Tax=Apiospora kogelbergensis TaxID=1337665 RepID=A0AAW0QRY1_9PEZI
MAMGHSDADYHSLGKVLFQIAAKISGSRSDVSGDGLQNRLNRDEQTGIYLPPTRSPDCQEIDADCGRAMIQILRRDDLGQMV